MGKHGQHVQNMSNKVGMLVIRVPIVSYVMLPIVVSSSGRFRGNAYNWPGPVSLTNYLSEH